MCRDVPPTTIWMAIARSCWAGTPSCPTAPFQSHWVGALPPITGLLQGPQTGFPHVFPTYAPRQSGLCDVGSPRTTRPPGARAANSCPQLPTTATLWPVPSSGAAHHCPGTRTVQRLWGRHREDVCLLLFRSSWVTWGVTSTEFCAGNPMSSISRGTCFLRPVPVLGKEHPVIRNAASVALWRSAILPDPSMVQITPQPEG